MTDILPPTPEAIAEAARHILDGGLVAFPTETVYGLGADATNDEAVAAVFAAKDRPAFNPLIVHFAEAAGVADVAPLDGRAAELAGAFWPGALTLVLPRRDPCPVSLLASAGLDTVAVRIPHHRAAHDLLAAAGRPVAAPSANPSGRASPTPAAHVAETLGAAVSVIIDGGPCRVGLESTVIYPSGTSPRLLRPGGIPAEDIEAVVGPLARPDPGAAPASPGMGSRHYAPGRPLRMNALSAGAGEALLAFGPDAPEGAPNLSPTGNLEEAAANFFAMIRALDTANNRGIAVMPIPESGLGRAINDRLRRAANA